MTSIKFTKNSIDNNDARIIQVAVNKFSFNTEKGNKEIEKIIFEGVPPAGEFNNKDELKNLLENNQNFELSFEDSQIKVIVIESEGGSMNMVASAGSASGPSDKKLKIRV